MNIPVSIVKRKGSFLNSSHRACLSNSSSFEKSTFNCTFLTSPFVRHCGELTSRRVGMNATFSPFFSAPELLQLQADQRGRHRRRHLSEGVVVREREREREKRIPTTFLY